MQVERMIHIPIYDTYNGERQIALLDNSSIAFLEYLHQKGYCSEKVLNGYDAILVPGWVLNEVESSPFRSQYLTDLQRTGLPIYRVNEESFANFAEYREGTLFHIVNAAVAKLGALVQYMNRNVKKADILDLEPYDEWIAEMYDKWPIPGEIMANGEHRKKNAGEISLTVLCRGACMASS